MVLYADILFFVDFSMDYLSLFLAAKLLSLPIGKKTFFRTLAASACGGLYGVVAVACGIDGIFGAILMFFVSFGMSAIAFGVQGGIFSLMRTTCTVWGCGALLGGVITAFSGMFSGAGGSGFDMICAAAIASVGIVSLIRRRLIRGYAEISFRWNEYLWRGRALVDSGNLLTDPVGGYPVLLLSVSAARTFMKEEADTVYAGIVSETSHGIRAVPIHTVNGTSILYGFLCREIAIRHGNRNYIKSAVVCIDHGADRKGSYSGCEAILPAALLF